MVPVASSPSEAFCHLQGVVTLLEESTSQFPWWPDLEGEWSKWPPNMGWWTKAMPCLDQLSAPCSKVKIGQSEVYRIKWEKNITMDQEFVSKIIQCPQFPPPTPSHKWPSNFSSSNDIQIVLPWMPLFFSMDGVLTVLQWKAFSLLSHKCHWSFYSRWRSAVSHTFSNPRNVCLRVWGTK